MVMCVWVMSVFVIDEVKVEIIVGVWGDLVCEFGCISFEDTRVMVRDDVILML